MILKVKKLTETAKLPTRGSALAAGLDLFADVSKKVMIMPGQTVMVKTGVAVEIPEGYFGGIYARSGLAIKEGLRPANCVGVIDSDYRGELIVALHSDKSELFFDVREQSWKLNESVSGPVEIEPGQRIAQLIIEPYLPVELEEVEELSSTDRGSGGFGSTGTK